MSHPDPNPETGGRPLAEILREAGIDMSRSARRRRWNDPEWEDPVPQRRREPEADSRPNPGRRLTDQPDGETAGRRAEPDPDTGGRRAERVMDTGGRRAEREVDTGGRRAQRNADTGGHRAQAGPDTGGRRSQGRADTGGHRPGGARAADPSTEAIQGLRPSSKPGVPSTSGPVPALPTGPLPAAAPTGRSRTREPEPASGAPESARTTQRPDSLDDNPATGPIPIPGLGDEGVMGGRESALAWLRFGGELLIALAAGVGVYFAFTVLWEQVPYLAVLAAPLVVTGLVGGVALWRSRLGREQVGAWLLIVLVFAGTLLTIVPAADLLSG